MFASFPESDYNLIGSMHPLIDAEQGEATKKWSSLQLFKYQPSSLLPKLRLHKDCTDKSPLVAIASKPSFVILGRRIPQSNWKYICINDTSGWIEVPDGILFNKDHLKRIYSVRKCETYKSGPNFIFNGKYFTGTDLHVFITSNVLMLAASISFFYEVHEKLSNSSIIIVSNRIQRC